MQPNYVIAGYFQRDYILPPHGQPVLDAPGGNMLYAAGGLGLWADKIGLVSKVGEDLPRAWLTDIQKRGFDIRGIKISEKSLDLRNFIAYNDFETRSQSSPVSHFARREMTFPKSLLGYQTPAENNQDPHISPAQAPSVLNVPKDYLDTRAVHICPMDFTTQSQMAAAFKGGSVSTLSLDPAPNSMSPALTKELRILLRGITVFLPSEDELRSLYWNATHDLWEMATEISTYGCEIIVIKRGGQGQLIYDAVGKRRWDVPAYPVHLVDPTGAGDALCGGYLYGYQKTFDPLEAALYASVSASFTVEGSTPYYPMEALPGLAEARLHDLRELVRAI